MVASRADKLRDMARIMRKQYGPRATGSAAALRSADMRITSGAFGLDYALGGGIPVGRNTMFYGDRSCGKSTSAMRIVGNAQRLCRRCMRPARNLKSVPPPLDVLEQDPDARWSAEAECDCYQMQLCTVEPPTPKDFGEKDGSKAHKQKLAEWEEELTANSYEEFVCAWIDLEDSFDVDWATRLGVDTRRVYLACPSLGEEGVDMTTNVISTGVDMIVIDSLAHFTPRTEFEDSAGDWQQGLMARIVNKGIRKWVSAAAAERRDHIHGVTQIWINQMRTKINAYGDPNVKPAGKGQDFAAHVEIYFRKGKAEVQSEQYKNKDDIIERPIKETFTIRTTKNKTASTRGVEEKYTQLTRDTDVATAGHVMDEERLFKMANYYLVKKEGNEYTLCDRTFKIQREMLEAIRGDDELRNDLYSRLLSIAMKSGAEVSDG